MMLSLWISSFLIYFILGHFTRSELTDHYRENSKQVNHTTKSEEDTRNEHLSWDNETEHPQSKKNKQDAHKQDLHHKNDNLRVEHHDKVNITKYLQNVTSEATNELTAIWWGQRIYMNGIEEEKNVIFQQYKIDLKRITYLVNRTHNLIAKQCKIITKMKWNERDEEVPQPYHDEVIGELAKNLNEIERYFRENKLRTVDFSVRRINKLIQKAKEELTNRRDRLKELIAEIERLKSYH